MSEIFSAIGHALVWNLVSLPFALAVLPLFLAFLPPAVAWGASRVLSPWLVAYLTILPAAILGRADFGVGAISVATVLVAVMGWGMRLRAGERSLPRGTEWRSFELYHLVALAAAAAFVAYIPSTSGMGERMRDTALWNGLWIQQTFPLEDPWYAGEALRYYAFGYYPPMLLGLFARTAPLVAYNMAIAWTFTTYGGGLYLAFRSVGFERRGALFGAALVALGSNGKSLLQALSLVFADQSYNWWEPSRVIRDTINEFPLWSFSLGDLHPHYLVLPLFPMLTGFLVGLFDNAEDPFRRRIHLAASAVVVAWFWGGNTWEVPIAFGLLAVVMALMGLAHGWRRTVIEGAVTLPLVVIMALPFIRGSAGVSKSFGIVKEGSSTWELFLTFGLFFLPIALYPWMSWNKKEGKEWVGGALLLLGLSFALQSATLFVLTLLALLVAAWRTSDIAARRGITLAGFGLLIVLAAEWVHLKDVYGDQLARLNTVFKFYMPAWACFGVASVILGRELSRWMPRRVFVTAAILWAVALGAHFSAGLWARTGGYRDTASLAGLGIIAKEGEDDAKLIRWLQGEVAAGRLRGVMLEAPGRPYSTYARFGSTTGIRLYAAWENYGFWHIYGLLDEAGKRFNTAKDILNGKVGDCDGIKRKLNEERIDYVAVGTLERKDFEKDGGLEKLVRCLTPLHREGTALLLGAP